jgi:mRNA interferase MazF
MECDPGDVVLVRFRFSSGDQEKRRPAVIISTDAYHRVRADAIMCALSTNVGYSYLGDYSLEDWRESGLPKPTKAKGVIQTIERAVIDRKLGTLTARDWRGVIQSIAEIICTT